MIRKLLAVACILFAVQALAQTTSRGTYLALMRVQELWEQQLYDDAVVALQDVIERTQGNDRLLYDFLIANHYLAQTNILADRPAVARIALEAALATERIERFASLSADLKLLYGQVLLNDEDYPRAEATLEQWFVENGGTGQPVQVFLLGYANFMNEHFDKAEERLGLALGGGMNDNDSWYQLYYQSMFAQGKYESAELLLHQLLAKDTTKDLYWRLLTNHYLQLENGPRALSAMNLEHLLSLVDTPEDMKRLAALYSYVEIPEKGARLLEEWMRSELIPADYATLRQTGDFWLLAREREKSLAYLERAANLVEDGRTHELIGTIHFEDERWPEAFAAFQQAIAKGALDDEARIHLLSGVSAWRTGQTDAATAALEKAAQADAYRGQAEGLLAEIQSTNRE